MKTINWELKIKCTRKPGILSGRSSISHREILELKNSQRLMYNTARIQICAHKTLFWYRKHVILGTKHVIALSARYISEIPQQTIHINEPMIDTVHFEAVYPHVVIERKISQQPIGKNERIVRVVYKTSRCRSRGSCCSLLWPLIDLLSERLEKLSFDRVDQIVTVVVAVQPSRLCELTI